jgi:hypothetical protein
LQRPAGTSAGRFAPRRSHQPPGDVLRRASITSEIADLATSLGEEDLEKGEHLRALQVLEQGLRVSPYDEPL